MTESPKTRRRWFRFRLRTFLLAWLAFGAWLGFWIHSARQQREAVAKIKQLADYVFIDYSFQRGNHDPLNWRPDVDYKAISPVPNFALNRLGVDYFHNVFHVNVIRGRMGKELELADQLVRLPKLEQLVLVEVDVTDEMVQRLVAARHLTGLEFRGRPTDESLHSISTLPKLQLLDVGGNFTDDGVACLSRLRTLRFLRLEGIAITDVGLAQLASMPSLERLEISPPARQPLRITDRGFEQLAQLRKLESLSMCCSAQITGTAITKLAACKNLRRLSFYDCGTTDADLEAFQSFSALESLELCDAKTSGSGFKNLTGLNNLKILGLPGSTTTDDAIAYLAELPSLEMIDLSRTRVTAAGLEKFRQSPKLRRLVISEASSHSFFGLFPSYSDGFTTTELKRLRQALPSCKVDSTRDF